VGIGASAGGLAAFNAFLDHMPPDSGMVFVLVQHLAPDHKSMLVELLRAHTSMRVLEAQDGLPLTRDHVYVIPPDATLTIENGLLCVSTPAPAREYRRPIDTFFSSLAEDQGELAVSIVLSGVGSDGTLGLGSVKEHGGLTLAQADFDDTALSGMPHSAAATGLVDHVISVETMPAKLIDYQRHLSEVACQKDSEGTRQDTLEHLATVTALLRARLGHDFTAYKEKTLIRRIQRRMQVLQVEGVPAYIEFLREEPRELNLLFREFLIGVTEFFRNPEAFDVLQATVLSKLPAQEGGAIRIWVPGCATGEEVYSIAILLKEVLDQRHIAPRVQIFGSDIDDHAVAIARIGRYQKGIAAVSPDRLERWFVRDGEDYCLVKEIREMCVFSTHSLVKDPPFSKLDLISCRNLLIYLNHDLQRRVIQTFHYALRSGAYLFLGPSESASRDTKLFTVLDKEHRILQRSDTSVSTLPDFQPTARGGRAEPAARSTGSGEDRIDKIARHMMEKHSPAYMVVDKHLEILRFSGSEMGRYLEPSPGPVSFNLSGILRKELRPAVRAAVHEALATQRPVVNDTLAVVINGQSRGVRLIVEPIVDNNAEAGPCLIAYQDLPP
jgi:two-component system, chemotaxis family, CheB/CheR fusion protein